MSHGGCWSLHPETVKGVLARRKSSSTNAEYSPGGRSGGTVAVVEGDGDGPGTGDPVGNCISAQSETIGGGGVTGSVGYPLNPLRPTRRPDAPAGIMCSRPHSTKPSQLMVT